MKKFSKILALVLSLIMVMSCFVACSDKKAADDAKTTVKTSKTDTDKKIEKADIKDNLDIKMVKNPDIVKTIAKNKKEKRRTKKSLHHNFRTTL